MLKIYSFAKFESSKPIDGTVRNAKQDGNAHDRSDCKQYESHVESAEFASESDDVTDQPDGTIKFNAKSTKPNGWRTDATKFTR